MDRLRVLVVAASCSAWQAQGQPCPGTLNVSGYGHVALVPTGWHTPYGGAAVELLQGPSLAPMLVPNMGSRAYFASVCSAGIYDHNQYLALNLLGKTLKFTVDLAGVGCGCNAAFYLVSMRQNPRPSKCFDYYCDANNVCGESCAEIDIMEANQFAWHSTLHTTSDHNGLGAGYGGGGDAYNGPRDWTSSQYGPGGTCIDTSKAFDVSVSFPTNAQGSLQAMAVTLSQSGHACPLSTSIADYPGMTELSAALRAGMTPVVSYWSSNEMLWMDGKGADSKGPCRTDNTAACVNSFKLYAVAVESLNSPPQPESQGTVEAVEPDGVSPVDNKARCPGTMAVTGFGKVEIVPTGWHTPDGGALVEVLDSHVLVPHMGGRAYFANSCNAGVYDHNQYTALNLLGKTLTFSVDLTGAGCGCNAAFYLVSMRQNPRPSTCLDYYCDANNVCGESCAEIDIMEANQFAWHSTLHTSQDHNGMGVGYGGGSGFNGPRDWSGSKYAPGGSCIDTLKLFEVAVSFPINAQGSLTAMEVTLSQEGHSCPLSARIATYPGMAELSAALSAGMTPVVSYWSSNDMLWMDGKGTDSKGPCVRDNAAACSNSVKFYGFKVAPIGSTAEPKPSSAQEVVQPAALSTVDNKARCPGSIDVTGFGKVEIVPTGWHTPGGGALVEVINCLALVQYMGGRAYFANACNAGSYDHNQYIALNLLGKTLTFSVDLTGAGCGCNAALYLVSMRQNPRPSNCFDYYCDANNVCGESCAEIDIMEANQFAWHSTLHTSQDHNGMGVGYGGGSGFNGPRDWSGSQYAPGGSCIDTTKPFEVAASFPVNAQGSLAAMEVTLWQEGQSCPLSARIATYPGMAELSAALSAGMTPVVSYWSSNDMLWMDGKGTDSRGPCLSDNAAACSASVRLFGFRVVPIVTTIKSQANTTAEKVANAHSGTAANSKATCPGKINVGGYGAVEMVPAGWHSSDGGAPVEVLEDLAVVPHMGGRVYFANACSAGVYDHNQYTALNLLGKTFRFTVDLTGAGCGCNAAFYLVSMQQNPRPSQCFDYYCDANSVCGESCAEIDIMEANQYAWHSTLHTSQDHNGMGDGYGGGAGWNGPRAWSGSQYAPGGACIDTLKPFEIMVSFPVDAQGILVAMEVVLSQQGKSCPLSARVVGYPGLVELSAALRAGMTPVLSYWSSNDMVWMDGKGTDGQGPCVSDNAAACSATVKFSSFAIESIGADAGQKAATVGGSTTEAAPPPGGKATCPGKLDMTGYGPLEIIPTGWHSPHGGARVDVLDRRVLVPHMGGRAYFASTCSAGNYDHNQYLAVDLRGRTLRFSVDLSGAGCGCNAALYLVSMQQNPKPSDCSDYYCDANNVCGVSCAEIDIMEANQYSWHSTLHTTYDHNGMGAGYGGGKNFNGPRDWSGSQYGPGGSCVDTTEPFEAAVTFSMGAGGQLEAMEVTLTQRRRSCPLSLRITGYPGMAELSEALAAGMTPVVSYWSSNDMLWMDGKGLDRRGPCDADNAAACAGSVKFSGFAVEPPLAGGEAETPHGGVVQVLPLDDKASCPGVIGLIGHGPVHIVPTGWHMPGGGAPVQVLEGPMLVPHMGARAYFASNCTAGVYDHNQYLALCLLRKTMKFTVDLAGAGCGCNVAFYLVSMRQNTRPSKCFDYYCDANKVCGESCAEINIMEANQFAWHSTLHTSSDHTDAAVGYGGGDGYNGPRDWTASQFSPGSTCIDTSKPFEVAASFPVNADGSLAAMEVTLLQHGHSCPLAVRITDADYPGMAELSVALDAGMTPVISYWSSDKMLWMDGKGQDSQGPCVRDNATACPESVKFYGFSVLEIGMPAHAQNGKDSGSLSSDKTGLDLLLETAQKIEDAEEAAIKVQKEPGAKCPGNINIGGHSPVAMVPTGWHNGKDADSPMQVLEGRTLAAHMGARAYFANTCTAGHYDHNEYVAMKLLGKTIRYTVDLTGAGCGCNAAFYLVSMQQNTEPSKCLDYYCDASNVCGVSCAEIDIMEANQFSWHSTLHTSHDHNGVGAGYGGGGSAWSGPRDWQPSQYSPGSTCIDTTRPFNVSASFPVNTSGALAAMEVTLSQHGSACPLSVRVDKYAGMAELSAALVAGMTPVVSYWSSDGMLWMDGKGQDAQGPCARDNATMCGRSVQLSRFSIENIGIRTDSNDAKALLDRAMDTLLHSVVSPGASPAEAMPPLQPAAPPAPASVKTTPAPPAVPPVTPPPAPVSPAVALAVCSPIYGQCGGKFWTGPRCCATGLDCHDSGPYYSQCQPMWWPHPEAVATPAVATTAPTTAVVRAVGASAIPVGASTTATPTEFMRTSSTRGAAVATAAAEEAPPQGPWQFRALGACALSGLVGVAIGAGLLSVMRRRRGHRRSAGAATLTLTASSYGGLARAPGAPGITPGGTISPSTPAVWRPRSLRRQTGEWAPQSAPAEPA